MGKVQLALWAVQNWRLLLGLAAVILLLPLLGVVAVGGVLLSLPMASPDKLALYQDAVKGLPVAGLDYRQPLAIDAVRRRQDLSRVTAQVARSTADLFVKEELREVPCPKGPCYTKVYSLKSLEDVMNEIGFDDMQKTLTRRMAGVDLAPLYCGAGFTPSPAARFAWPVPSSTALTSCFGSRQDPTEPGRQEMHTGIDIAATTGAPVVAVEAGFVTYTGWLGNYGQVVIVQHPGDGWTWYAHLETVYVSMGQPVSRGQVIAGVGSTGKSTGPHLHFEVRPDGQPVDPLPYFR